MTERVQPTVIVQLCCFKRVKHQVVTESLKKCRISNVVKGTEDDAVYEDLTDSCSEREFAA